MECIQSSEECFQGNTGISLHTSSSDVLNIIFLLEQYLPGEITQEDFTSSVAWWCMSVNRSTQKAEAGRL